MFLIRKITALFLFVFSAGLNAQMLTVSDPGFLAYLQNAEFSSCLSGNQLNTSCPLVVNATKVNCSNFPVVDISAINAFVNLDTLIAQYTQIAVVTALPPSIRHLEISWSQLTALPSLPPNLEYLGVSVNDLTSLPALPASLTYLRCSSNELQSLPALPPGLIRLEASNNQISSIDNFPNTLTHISLNSNLLDSLPVLPDGLISLRVSDNSLSELPPLPVSLTELNCNSNEITEIQDLSNMVNLNSLSAGANHLDSLPYLFNTNLNFLSVAYNQITALPELPSTLKILFCNYNEIDSIPELPDGLEILIVAGNHLTSLLPELPTTLLELNCNDCNLPELPDLPPSLTKLFCFNNELTQLPALPPTVNHLNCAANQLSALPPLAPELYQLVLYNNPNLSCLPPVQRFLGNLPNNFQITNGTSITCLPNYIERSFVSQELDNLPLCGIYSNPNGCDIAWNVSGRVFHDSQPDCQINTVEAPLNQIKLKLYQNGSLMQQVYTGPSGHYSFDLPLDNYEVRVDTNSIPFFVDCPATAEYTDALSVSDSLDYDRHFGLRCKPGYDLSAHSMVHTNGLFFPTNTATVQFQAGDMAGFYGTTCNTENIPGVMKVWLDGPAAFVNPPVDAIQDGDTLIYQISNLAELNILESRFLSIVTDTFPAPGSNVCLTVKLSAQNPLDDQNLSNNALVQCFDVVNSYDPNFKVVSPDRAYEGGQWHYFTFQFQNTGTAAAQNIRVLDTLSTYLDWDSFEYLASSHDNFIQINAEGIVTFHFPGINLPDSTSDEPNSKGWVQFRIKTVESLPDPVEIANSVAIYFDFNAPIITNDAIIYHCIPSYSSLSAEICSGDSIYFGNRWIYNSGEYLEILPAADGCDSLLTLNVTVSPPGFSTLNEVICEGDTLNILGYQFTQAGNYSFEVPATRCDSFIVLNLNVIPFEAGIELMNNTLIAPGGVQAYQWFDCLNNQPILGQNASTFSPSYSGLYAVQLTSTDGCTAMSECIQVIVTSNKNEAPIAFQIWPNPAQYQINIRAIQNQDADLVRIYDVSGRLLSEETVDIVHGNTQLIVLNELAEGMYWITLIKGKSVLHTERLMLMR